MELKTSLINLNPKLANWSIPQTVSPGDYFEFCEGWVLSLQSQADNAGFAIEPLAPISKSGLRLHLGAGQSARLGSRIEADAAERRGVWRMASKLRGLAQNGAFPKLDAAYLARVSQTGTWLFESQVFGETRLNEDWIELTSFFQLDRPLPRRPLVGRLWLRLRALLGIGDDRQGKSLLLVLHFSEPGTVEIEFCQLEDERLETSPARESLATGDSARGSRLPDENHTLRSHTGASPITQAGIVAILEGRVLGWVQPEPSKVSGSVHIDGEPAGAIATTPFNGAETALLRGKPGWGFAVDVPTHLMDGKRHRVGLYDNLTSQLIKESEAGLVLQEGLHVPDRQR